MARDLIRPADADRFTFRHILIREVAYQTLPRAERASLHANAGEWLEAQAAGREDALAELIAYHYREAVILGSALRQAETQPIRARAVHWLGRAASTAQAGAASDEAARHLRAAIELANSTDYPELYERLGDVQAGGDACVDAYATSLRLCREAERPPDHELRILGKFITVIMRYQGSVASRPSDDTMAQLLAEGHALMARARDERAIAAFLVGEGFHPYWRRKDATPEDVSTAEAGARRGLATAERLDDAKLQSVALDALSACVMVRGAWREVIQLAEQRLALQDRLDLLERIDAYGMIAWWSGVGGDLKTADRVSSTGLATLQPGQVSWGALHLAARRIYALTLQGKWDDVLTTAAKAKQLWIASNRIAAGYSLRGFATALDVARARRDQKPIEEITEIIEDILQKFRLARNDSTEVKGLEPYAHLNFAGLIHYVENFPFRYLPTVDDYEADSFAAGRPRPARPGGHHAADCCVRR